MYVCVDLGVCMQKKRKENASSDVLESHNGFLHV